MLVPLREIDLSDQAEFGAKAANLARLIRLGFPVPEGFCISGRAYQAHMNSGSISAMMEAVLNHDESLDPEERRGRLKLLREEIARVSLNTHLVEQIEKAHQGMRSDRVAVRSSATSEDLP